MTAQGGTIQRAGQSAAMVKYDQSSGFQITSMGDAMAMAVVAMKSGMAPPSFKTPESIVIAWQRWAELGYGDKPMQALDSIAVVNGRPTLYGDAIPALVLDSGQCLAFEEWYEIDGKKISAQQASGPITDKWCAVCLMHRKGQKEPRIERFSVSDARSASLWGKSGPWKQYPKKMLLYRARAFCARAMFADRLRGMGIKEEVEDYPPGAFESVGVLETTGRPLPRGYHAAKQNGDQIRMTELLGGPGHFPMPIYGDDGVTVERWEIGRKVRPEPVTVTATVVEPVQEVAADVEPEWFQKTIEAFANLPNGQALDQAGVEKLKFIGGKPVSEWGRDEYAKLREEFGIRQNAKEPEPEPPSDMPPLDAGEPESQPSPVDQSSDSGPLVELRKEVETLCMEIEPARADSILQDHGVDGFDALAACKDAQVLNRIRTDIKRMIPGGAS